VRIQPLMVFSDGSMDVADEAMASMGVSHIAYIRPLSKGEGGYAVCSADGRQLAVFPNYDAAFFTARQYNLAPVNVH
jgi:hypothetical protein